MELRGCDSRIAGTCVSLGKTYYFCTWTRQKSDSTRIRPKSVRIRPDTVRSKPFEANVKQILLVFGSVFGPFFDRSGFANANASADAGANVSVDESTNTITNASAHVHSCTYTTTHARIRPYMQ